MNIQNAEIHQTIQRDSQVLWNILRKRKSKSDCDLLVSVRSVSKWNALKLSKGLLCFHHLLLGFRVWNKRCVIVTYYTWKGKRWAQSTLMCDDMPPKNLRVGSKCEAIFHRNSRNSWIIFLIIKESSKQDIKISIFDISIDLCLNWTVMHSIIWHSSSYIWIGLSRLGRPKAGLQKNKILVLELRNLSEKTR